MIFRTFKCFAHDYTPAGRSLSRYHQTKRGTRKYHCRGFAYSQWLPRVDRALKIRLPFYHFKGKGLCYVTYHVTVKKVVVGFMDGKQMRHPLLKQTAKQKRVRHLIYEASEDWPE